MVSQKTQKIAANIATNTRCEIHPFAVRAATNRALWYKVKYRYTTTFIHVYRMTSKVCVKVQALW